MATAAERIPAAPQTAEEDCINEQFEAPDAKYECPICLAWLRDPVVTACGHRFCQGCIDSWLTKEDFCPVDNMKLHRSDIYPDNFTRREISQQRTKCPNIKRGCMEELSPLDVEQHLLVCKFKPVVYQLPENEKLRCSFVDMGCDCKFDDEPGLQRHLEHDLQKHLLLLSSAYRNLSVNSQNTASAIAHEANFWDPPAKSDQGASSSAATSADSVEMLLKSLYEKVIEQDQKSREQDIIISNMNDQIAANNVTMSQLSQRFCCGNFVWYVTDFKSKMNQMHSNPSMMFYSPGFFTSYYGYKFCIRMNLSPRNPNFIALLVHMMKTDHDNTLEWPFCGRIIITVVHPLESFRNIKETMMTRPELEAFQRPTQDLNPRGFGYTEFASLEELLGNEYFDNNQLIVKVTIQPV